MASKPRHFKAPATPSAAAGTADNSQLATPARTQPLHTSIPLQEHLLRLDRHRLTQKLSPLLAALERTARTGDAAAASRLTARVRTELARF